MSMMNPTAVFAHLYLILIALGLGVVLSPVWALGVLGLGLALVIAA